MAAKLETSSLLPTTQQLNVSSAVNTTPQPLTNSTILVHSVSTPERADNSNESKCCGIQYRIEFITSKGVMIVLLWTLFLHIAIPFDTSVHLLQLSIDVKTPHKHKNLDSIFQSRALYRALFFLYPLMGWIADAKIGRYKALMTSVISIFIASVLMVIGYLIHICSMTKSMDGLNLLVTVLLGFGVLFNVCGFACFDANAIPFLTDQYLGASGENLSALIHWQFWVHALAEIVNVSVNEQSIVLANRYLTFGTLITHFLCVSAVLISCFICKRWLDTTPFITNPIKLMFKVLQYSSRHSFPQNRSALTYWEDSVPSRVELGKEKYGGPFTEEEVEDVKTSFRLLPLVFLSVGFGLMLSQVTYIGHLHSPVSKNDSKPAIISTELIQNQGFQNSLSMLIMVPLFRFFIYPCFYNRVPSVLKRVGFGLFLTVLHLAYITILDVFITNNPSTNNTVCLLKNRSFTNEFSLDFYWGLPFVTLGALGELFVVPFMIEFIVAQTPNPMKGLMIGLWFCFYGIMQLFGIYSYFPFKEISNTANPSCVFYYNLTKTLISGVIFVTFCVLAYRYKLRTRDVPINFNMLADTHISKYLSITQEDKYVRDISHYESDTTSSCSSCES